MTVRGVVGCPVVGVAATGDRDGEWSDSQWHGADAVERGDQLSGPGPVISETESALSCRGDALSSGVEQAVAEPFRFGMPATPFMMGGGKSPMVTHRLVAAGPHPVKASRHRRHDCLMGISARAT